MTQPGWVVRSRIERFLPVYIQLREDKHFLFVCCTRCGHQSVFQAPLATPSLIIAAAQEHRCVSSYRPEYLKKWPGEGR